MVNMGIILKKLALENHLAVLVSSSLSFVVEARVECCNILDLKDRGPSMAGNNHLLYSSKSLLVGFHSKSISLVLSIMAKMRSEVVIRA